MKQEKNRALKGAGKTTCGMHVFIYLRELKKNYNEALMIVETYLSIQEHRVK